MSYPQEVHAAIGGGEHLANAATQKNYDLGQRLRLEDNRIYRYAENFDTALITGSLVEGKPYVSGDNDLAVATAAAVGDTDLSITCTQTTAADYYAEGWCAVTKAAAAAALGQAFQVRTHIVLSAAAVTFYLKANTPVVVAIAAADEVGFTPCVYKDVVIAATTLAGMLAGVAHCALPADYFGWLQTGGVGAVKAATSTVLGNHVDAITAAAGRAGVPDGNGKFPTIGHVMTIASTADECDTVYLTIDN